MKDFLLVFRADDSQITKRSVEEGKANTKLWMDWIAGIAAQNKLGDRGNRLELGGRVLRGNNVVTNGPYAEIKESIGGYSIVKADSYDAAVELAKGCPILLHGGSVEVREVGAM